MKNVKTTMIASAIALSCGAGNVLADSWIIVQEANLNTNATTLTQNANGSTGAASSVQAINNINLGSDGVIDTGSTQTLNTSQAITFDQDNAGADNIQAVNNAVTPTVTDLTQTLTSSAAQTIKFEQGIDGAIGTGNVQAVNRVKATTVTKLSQTISGSANTTLDFDQGSLTATNAIQAGNLIDASTAGDTVSDANVSQTVDVLASNMEQNLTTASLQANNALITPTTGGTAGGGGITQTFTNGTLTMLQSGTNGSYQSGNYVGVTPW